MNTGGPGVDYFEEARRAVREGRIAEAVNLIKGRDKGEKRTGRAISITETFLRQCLEERRLELDKKDVAVGAAKNDADRARYDLTTVKAELASTKAELAAAKTRLSAIEPELAAVKTEAQELKAKKARCATCSLSGQELKHAPACTDHSEITEQQRKRYAQCVAWCEQRKHTNVSAHPRGIPIKYFYNLCVQEIKEETAPERVFTTIARTLFCNVKEGAVGHLLFGVRLSAEEAAQATLSAKEKRKERPSRSKKEKKTATRSKKKNQEDAGLSEAVETKAASNTDGTPKNDQEDGSNKNAPAAVNKKRQLSAEECAASPPASSTARTGENLSRTADKNKSNKRNKAAAT